MLRPNAEAARVARAVGTAAATDVSGFGLAGHLGGLARASGLVAEVRLGALPALAGVRGLLARGVRSTFHAQNARSCAPLAVDPAAAADPALELLFDPQTSGGLVFGVPAGRSAEALRALHAAGDTRAAVIGRLRAARPGEPPLSVLASDPETGDETWRTPIRTRAGTTSTGTSSASSGG
jgi:selenide,water dikinase